MCYTRIIRIESFQYLPIFPFILLGKQENFFKQKSVIVKGLRRAFDMAEKF